MLRAPYLHPCFEVRLSCDIDVRHLRQVSENCQIVLRSPLFFTIRASRLRNEEESVAVGKPSQVIVSVELSRKRVFRLHMNKVSEMWNKGKVTSLDQFKTNVYCSQRILMCLSNCVMKIARCRSVRTSDIDLQGAIFHNVLTVCAQDYCY